jgi:hypothetical protein
LLKLRPTPVITLSKIALTVQNLIEAGNDARVLAKVAFLMDFHALSTELRRSEGGADRAKTTANKGELTQSWSANRDSQFSNNSRKSGHRPAAFQLRN